MTIIVDDFLKFLAMFPCKLPKVKKVILKLCIITLAL